ncbi:radical SAM protein [Myxococcota bacterium]|nr:radical SAM protein [Myxococcota bacterium]MBU1411574.1 radical SAM protein [Myxococcota bacterium]MBU1509102.1 radical SAM protein [Myxococcota bacterium]
MHSPISTSYLTGPGRAAFTVGLWIRLARRLVRGAGAGPATVRLWRYWLRESRLSASMPGRLVRHRGHVWAVPDLPPLDTVAFLECMEREVASATGHGTPAPVTAIVSITGRCPHHCPYCYVDAARREAVEPTVDLLESTIAGLATAGVFTFHFSGGEPALRADDLVALLGRCVRPERHFWMLTTGTGLEAGHLARLAGAGLSGVMVSMDSHDLAHVNRVKGGDTAWDTAACTMRQAREAGLLVAVNAVIGRPLLEEAAFYGFIETVGGLGASFVNCYAPRVQDQSLPPELAPFSIAEHRTLDRLCHRCNASSVPGPLAYTPDLWEAVRGCQGGRSFLYVDPAGDVRRCPFLQRAYGNIRDGNIANIIDKMQQDPDAEVCAGHRMLTEALGTGRRR